jgi:hypothetical protein
MLRCALMLALGVVLLAGVERQAAAQEGCASSVSQDWTAPGLPGFTIEAFADGPTCADAVAVLVIRDASGAAVWAQAFIAAYNFLLREATTPEAMESALEEWVVTPATSAQTTSSLPEWSADSEQPGGEFPLYPSELYSDRDYYAALRAADAPLLCVISGTESALCVAYTHERIDEVGYQSFPG